MDEKGCKHFQDTFEKENEPIQTEIRASGSRGGLLCGPSWSFSLEKFSQGSCSFDPKLAYGIKREMRVEGDSTIGSTVPCFAHGQPRIHDQHHILSIPRALSEMILSSEVKSKP